MKDSTRRILENVLFVAITVMVGIVMVVTALRIYENIRLENDADNAFDLGFLLMGSLDILFLMMLSAVKLKIRTHNQILFYLILLVANAHMMGTLYATAGLDGKSDLYIAELVALVSTPTILIIFWFYQRIIYKGENYRRTHVDRFVLSAGFADYLLIFFGSYFGKIFSFDEDLNYVAGPWVRFTFIFPIVVLLLLIVDNINNKMTRIQHIACLLFALTPMILAVVAVVTGNYLYSNIAFVISVLIIYVGIQGNMELESARKEADLISHRKMLDTDALTQLFSRFAYSRDMDSYANEAELPEDLVVFAMDVNGLKGANDTKGHEAGDELIKGSAECIHKALSSWGKCYRTGGDEFVSILNIPSDQVRTLEEALRNETKNWHGVLMDELSISIGTAAAADHPDLSLPELIGVADKEMYADKERYYTMSGKNRRRSR